MQRYVQFIHFVHFMGGLLCASGSACLPSNPPARADGGERAAAHVPVQIAPDEYVLSADTTPVEVLLQRANGFCLRRGRAVDVQFAEPAKAGSRAHVQFRCAQPGGETDME